MHKTRRFEYIPVIIGARQGYKISLPTEASPVVYKTLTTGMRAWTGQLVKCAYGRGEAFVLDAGILIKIEGLMVDGVQGGNPCMVMEHLNINGEMGFMIGTENILDGDLNFINFGIPNGRHLRIDAYTGDSRIIE